MPASDHTAESQSHPSAAAPAPSASPFSLKLTAASAPIWLATAALFLISLIFEPDSVRHSALLGMLPFAAVLAIAAMGQTLVVQQGGIDLSVPGMISLTIVLLTSYPNGDSGKLASAIVIALAATLAAGAISGVIVSIIGVTPIVATLGMNAVLYGVVIQVSAGNPPPTTSALAKFASGKLLGIPNTVIIAVVLTALVGVDHQTHDRRAPLRGGRVRTARGPSSRVCARAAISWPPTWWRRRCTAWRASCWPASCTAPAPSRATRTCCPRWRRSCWAGRRCWAAAAA